MRLCGAVTLTGDLLCLPEITRGILDYCWAGKTRLDARCHPENPLDISRHPSDWNTTYEGFSGSKQVVSIAFVHTEENTTAVAGRPAFFPGLRVTSCAILGRLHSLPGL